MEAGDGAPAATARAIRFVCRPGEQHDLLAEHPQVVDDLLQKIRRVVREGRSTAGEPQANDTPWWSDLSWMEKW